MRFRRHLTLCALLLLAVNSADCLASGGGPLHGPPTGAESSANMPEPASADDQAAAAYNAGVKEIGKAKEYEAEAAKASGDDKKQAKALAKASKSYDKALDKFEDAVDKDPGLFQAWNYVGFCQRHLGDYEEALTAYGRALELKPSYSEAFEYRAEAYLGLNRLEDAKSAYMKLFGTARPLADELMTSMHHWVEQRQRDPKGVSSTDLAAFAKWVDERATIAQQTVSLSIGTPKNPLVEWE